MADLLFPSLADGSPAEAIRFGDQALSHAELAGRAGAVAARLGGARRVAVWATPALETCVAVVGGLLAGVAVVPVNPKIGERDLGHILTDSAPDLVLAAPGVELPGPLAALPLVDVDLAVSAAGALPAELGPEAPAFIVYTSGTTGPPKGVVLPRRAVASNLDAFASAWAWTGRDVVVHGLPLFHVHGLIVGVLGPLRRGGAMHHLGRFSSAGVGRELAGDATMMFGVPTMYHRLAADCEADPELAKAVGQARLLVSGSAALPAADHERISRATGQRVVERYGMSETLMNCSVRADGDRRPGTVGLPLDGVDVRLVDDAGAPFAGSDGTAGAPIGGTDGSAGTPVAGFDGETIGEIEVRGPNLFTEYLNRPDATAEAMRGGWFRTGDMAVREADGYLRIVGRRATDLIKSGGYKIGAGEIENALLEHPGVAEAAVTGEPDEDLGERIVAWIVPAGPAPSAQELADHVARLLAPHKRPRVVHFLTELPRNDMGKVTKRALQP